ncbi:hypothetical protein K502DRAFT_365749 [Neoconidiobolus thromboides FSU 785]|nr:hypothetical protein K502DRAFT_365749 [Neoconidiobolus thromboides FSU 785]
MNDTTIRTSSLYNSLKQSLTKDTLTRGGLLPLERIQYISSIAGIWGFLLGGYQGGKLEGYRYLAEHQHKLPKTMDQWYFYHKRKNYKMMLEGSKVGSQLALRLIGLCCSFELIQLSCDVILFDAKNSWISSTIAGFSTATVFSLLNKLPKQSRRYAIFAGTGFGLLAGSLQHFIDNFKSKKEEKME